MPLIHLVQFKFKSEADESAIRDVCHGLISLKDKCVHPVTKELYIKSAVGGKDNSPGGLQHGFTHAFVLEFEHEEDRDYYVKKDKEHLAFVATLEGVVADAQIVDFVSNKY